MRYGLGPFWVRAPHSAAREALAAAALDLRPVGGEGWPDKLDEVVRKLVEL